MGTKFENLYPMGRFQRSNSLHNAMLKKVTAKCQMKGTVETTLDKSETPLYGSALSLCSVNSRRKFFANAVRNLHQVARDGDVLEMKCLLDGFGLKIKEKIDKLNGENFSPLHYAARYNHYDVAKLLVDRGADVNVRSETGLTPLHLTTKFNNARRNTFFSRPADDNGDEGFKSRSCASVDTVEISPFGKNKSVVQFLVSRCSEVNAKDNYGFTPLHYAATRGNVEVVRDLLQCPGIIVDCRDCEEMTPLHVAAIHGNCEVAEMLISSGAFLRYCDECLMTPLHRAAATGSLDVVLLLLRSARDRFGSREVIDMIGDRDQEHNTALHLAVEYGHGRIVELLISKGADVNAAKSNFTFPLHLASVRGNVDVVKALMNNCETTDFVNSSNCTPLHLAAEHNHAPVIEHLIKNGAELEKRNDDNLTPLLLSAGCGHVEAIECLLKFDAEIGAADKDDKTAVYLAAQHNRYDALVALLQNSTEVIDRTDRYGNSPLHVASVNGFLGVLQCLLNHGAQFDVRNQEDQTPLHLASKFGRTKVVRELLRLHKQAVDSADADGNAPLHLATLAGHEITAKALLEAGANSEIRNAKMRTPLDCAASKGWINVMKALLEADCSIDPPDETKATPLQMAAANGKVDAVLLLIEWGADVSRCDGQGRNCLVVAIDNSHKEVALAIVRSERWELALRCRVNYKDTPLRMLVKKMPEVAEEVFGKCTGTNLLPREHPLYTVTFNYEFLEDARRRLSSGESCNYVDDGLSASSSLEISPRGNYRSCARYGSDLKENHPLIVMVRSKRQQLLAHPLCVSLLHLKWISYGRYVYYSNLFLYLIFVFFLTACILATPTSNIELSRRGNSSSEVTEFQQVDAERGILRQIARRVIPIFVLFHLMRECFQMYMLRLYYFGLESLLEWVCNIAVLLYVVDFSSYPVVTDRHRIWQLQIGSASVFLVWINLVLFIRKLPYFGIYVVMFTDVLTTFCKVGIVFFFFIVAFGLGFHTVLYYEDPFASAGKSIVKTMVMMLGEVEFDNLFLEGRIRYPTTTYVIFVIFLVFVCLITMNLLVGLAVDDIKSVQENAILKRLAMQVELVLNVESVLPMFLLDRFVISEKSFMPNQKSGRLFQRLLERVNGSDALYEALATCEKSEAGRIQDQLQMLSDKLSHVTGMAQRLESQNQKLSGALMTILHHQSIPWEAEDNCSHDAVQI